MVDVDVMFGVARVVRVIGVVGLVDVGAVFGVVMVVSVFLSLSAFNFFKASSWVTPSRCYQYGLQYHAYIPLKQFHIILSLYT